jgi:DNA repair protein RadA/Sms
MAGKCPACDAWNSFIEEVQPTEVRARVAPAVTGSASSRPVALADVTMDAESRLRVGIDEFDRVMGGGIMLGSLTLIAGDPGIGKSTLMTELGRFLPAHTVLYVTGEESARQVKLRAERLGVDTGEFYLLAETNVEAIIDAAQEIGPDVLVVDSIQTIYRPDISSAPGSVSQVRESTAALLTLTKQMATATFLVGHVTKAGAIAGPRVLEHMVDTVVYFEGDRHHAYRILRTVKNRFGASGEIGLFEMREDGLHAVLNPSELLLEDRLYGQSGSAITCAIEGTRPLLVEIQALVSPASYGTPQRTATGFDGRRLQVLLAVLEKRERMRISQHDVFLNVAGGVRLEEPAVDLGVVLAGGVQPARHARRTVHGRHRRGGPRRRGPARQPHGDPAERGRAARVHAGDRAGKQSAGGAPPSGHGRNRGGTPAPGSGPRTVTRGIRSRRHGNDDVYGRTFTPLHVLIAANGPTTNVKVDVMRINNLKDLLEEQIKDLYSAQRQAEKAFARWASDLKTDEMKRLVREQADAASAMRARIEQIARALEINPTGEHCHGMEGLISEGDEFQHDAGPGPIRDAGMIAMAQRIQHYNIAGFGCSRTYARTLGHEEQAGVLQQMLEEAIDFDSRMTELAEQSLNEEAMA